MSGRITFGATITGGIQDVAGLLPLLGTQQCEEHIGSALTKGRLYAAATPMSIFGSLGVARAGFKTLIACMSGQTWSGAKILANMGFEPTGLNLSLIMVDKDDKDGRHLAETRLDELMKDLHVDKSRITVSHKCTRWNMTTILLTALLSSLGVIPYVHINLGGTNLTHFSQWTFPILRVIGGFLTASMMQIVIEKRIGRLIARHLAQLDKSETRDGGGGSCAEMLRSTGNVNHSSVLNDARESQEAGLDTHTNRHNGTGDIENGLGDPNAFSDVRLTDGKPSHTISSRHDAASGFDGSTDWVYLVLLLAGILSSVVGYVGCFSVVQNAKSHTGPLSWFCLEAGLSVIRMMLWGLHPKGDHAPPLELALRLDQDTTFLPTCNLDDSHISQYKILRLTRANQFLNMITSFAGIIERFTHPDLTLYYTLTRQRMIADQGRSDVAGKRVLYITLFDHKERTARVYARDGAAERFYSTQSDGLFIDLRHGLLEIKLDDDITSKDDFIVNDPNIRSLLQKHSQSIMDQIHFTLGEISNASISTPSLLPPSYTIETTWTLKAADAMSARERIRVEEQSFHGTWESTVNIGRAIEVDDSQPSFERDRLYLEHGWIEWKRKSLDKTRGQWVGTYMGYVTRHTRRHLEGKTTAMRRVDGVPTENERVAGQEDEANLKAEVEKGFIRERYWMEKLLVYEVEAWEGQFWTRVKDFMARNDVPESTKERLTMEWRGNCQRRLDTNIRAMEARMERVRAEIDAFPSDEFELQDILIAAVSDMQTNIWAAWQSVVEKFVNSTSSACFTPSIFNPQERLQELGIDQEFWRIDNPARLEEGCGHRQHRAMVGRLREELTDVKFRIAQGLDSCAQFFDDWQLLHCKYSRAKLLFLTGDLQLDEFEDDKAPLDFYLRALKSNSHAIYIDFSDYYDLEDEQIAEIVRHLPSSVTSIRFHNIQQLPPIQRDTPLFTYDDHDQMLETFLNNDQSLARTCDTYVFIQIKYGRGWVIAVSFVGPSCGNLILRLKHRSPVHDATLTVLGTPFTLSIPESFTIEEIILYPMGNSPSHLSFTPDARNNLIFQGASLRMYDYTLQDIQLLGEDRNPYGQPSQRNIPTAGFGALSIPDYRESWDFYRELDAMRTSDERKSTDSELQQNPFRPEVPIF